jgi:hypothetical protein
LATLLKTMLLAQSDWLGFFTTTAWFSVTGLLNCK